MMLRRLQRSGKPARGNRKHPERNSHGAQRPYAKFSPNFTRSAAKLLIFLHTAPFCSHNTSLIFVLTSAWVRKFCESMETKSTLEHRTPILGNRFRGL